MSAMIQLNHLQKHFKLSKGLIGTDKRVVKAVDDISFSVEKGERDGRTYTAVERLESARRREELARLTGGAHITPAMLAGAGELLDSAEAYKRGLT